MYPTVLIFHSWLRWLIVLFGVWAVFEAARGRALGRGGLFFTIALDVQLLLGVLLYVALSPVTQAALADMGAAMRNSTWRFWVAEHPALMILAVVCGHVARVVARRAAGGSVGQGSSALPSGRAPLLWFAFALLAILAAIPWPILSHGRPLFRL
jgi:hypothetical protein